ncbi:MAG: hypothetical protein AMS16_03475 [Planctomycetes bacterium DG_58]|nr:MAG: hypothetical protein AMS16_03475 [Planctomycetes bacterium DG_58]
MISSLETSRGRVRVVVMGLMALLWSWPAAAGTLEFTFTKYDPELWELHGLTEADFTKEGLRFHFPAGEDPKPKWIISKKLFIDDYNVLATIDRKRSLPDTGAVIVFDNPEAKRRAEMYYKTTRKTENTYGGVTYFKDGTKVGTRYGIVHPPFPGQDYFRLRKAAKRLFGAFPTKHGEGLIQWQTTWYPRIDLDEDCDEFHIGFMVRPPARGPNRARETEMLLKKLTISGPRVGGRDFDPTEPKVLRFDFGPVDQEVAKDYFPVSQYTLYAPERGYGWKTTLKPTMRRHFKELSNEESIRLGLGASYAEEGWRKSCDLTLNWTRHVKIRPLLSARKGWDRIEALGKTYDLKTPQAKDSVFACRHYGFPHDYRIEADQWEKRGAIYVDDDLSTEFVADVPNGRYNGIIGVGFTAGGPYHNVPMFFSIDAEGRTAHKKMRQNWARCNRFLINDIEVADGQLNLRFFADRRLSMNEVAPYNLACGWLINFLVLCPAEDPEIQRQEEWRLIMERSKRVRQLTFEPGDAAHVELTDGHIQLNGKPYLPIVLQYGYAWPRTTYGLYTWANCYTEGLGSSEIGGSAAFFRRDWKLMSHWDNYPWRAIAAMNNTIRHGALDFLYCENFIYIVPRAIEGEGGRLEDRRGRFNRWQVKPPLASRLAMEIINDSYTMLSNQLKYHPANPGYYVYEEFVHPQGYGYDHQSINRYQDYLSKQYKDIHALNEEWGRNYSDFSEVPPPKQDWDEGPEWRNFWKFRRYSMTMQVAKACEIVKQLEPEHTTMGQKCKPHPMSTTWHTAEHVELFGGGGPPTVHRAAAKHFGRATTMNAGYWDCPYAWVDGRRQLDHKPKQRRYLGKHLLPVYNDTISRYFQGTKGFWSEEYNDGVRHMFHRTSLIKRDSPKGKIKTWFGDIVFFDEEAHDYAPVTACVPPLRFSRAVQLGYRLGPLFLPAEPLRGDVAVLMTEDSFLVRTAAAGSHLWLNPTDNLLKQLNITYDVVRDENIDELEHYPVVLLAGYTETIAPEIVAALRKHVARGGKGILLDHALGYEAPRQKIADPAPAFGFQEIAGVTYRYERWPRPKVNGPTSIVAGNFLKTVKVGDVINPHPFFGLQVKLTPAKGSTVVAKMDQHVVGVMNRDGNVFTLSLPRVRVDWRGVQPANDTFRNLIGDVLEHWGLKRQIAHKAGRVPDCELRAMAGNGYWLAAVMNRADDTRTAAVALCFLPKGNYDVVDVTGERPLIVKNEKNELHLQIDPEFRASRWVATNVPSTELATKGLTLEVDGLMARVLLVRPAEQTVWVNAPESTLRKLAGRAGAVVVGDEATEAELAAARKIVASAKELFGKDLVLKKASEIQIEKTRNEVWVDPLGKGNPQSRQRRRYGTSGGYLVEAFENAPLKVDVNLILVGRADTNALVRHLETPNTFTYDKVLEKVTAAYPGKGRGLIELVECVNRVAYDTSSYSRDAILIAGSDDAGTGAAVERFLEVLKTGEGELAKRTPAGHAP